MATQSSSARTEQWSNLHPQDPEAAVSPISIASPNAAPAAQTDAKATSPVDKTQGPVDSMDDAQTEGSDEQTEGSATPLGSMADPTPSPTE